MGTSLQLETVPSVIGDQACCLTLLEAMLSGVQLRWTYVLLPLGLIRIKPDVHPNCKADESAFRFSPDAQHNKLGSKLPEMVGRVLGEQRGRANSGMTKQLQAPNGQKWRGRLLRFQMARFKPKAQL